MGSVYLGRHIVIGKKVAVKILHADLAGGDEMFKRFYREAQAAAAIGHKNIIDVLDVGASPQGDPYMVMEYLEGEDLDNMLARTGPINPAAACGIMEPILLALEAAHSKGIVHRDLKPANIFITQHEGEEPTVKLIDFGLAGIDLDRDHARALGDIKPGSPRPAHCWEHRRTCRRNRPGVLRRWTGAPTFTQWGSSYTRC